MKIEFCGEFVQNVYNEKKIFFNRYKETGANSEILAPQNKSGTACIPSIKGKKEMTTRK